MRYFFDTEFLEEIGRASVDLISIGIVSEDGREFYAENADIDVTLLPVWHQLNVVPHLTGPRLARDAIVGGIKNFVGSDPRPEFWAYFAAYDWVLFSQLFGSMLNVPRSWPKFCRDLRQLMWHLNMHKSELPKQSGTEHNALEDARWVKAAFERIKNERITSTGQLVGHDFNI